MFIGLLDCRYLVYLMFLAEGVSALPEDQLEMVDKLVEQLEQLEKDPEGGMQQIMAMLQDSAESMGADSMGDAGAASLKVDQWGGAGPVDDVFASMAQGNPVDNFMDLKGIFLPESRKAEEPPLLLAASQPSANRTAYLPDGPSDSAIQDSP